MSEWARAVCFPTFYIEALLTRVSDKTFREPGGSAPLVARLNISKFAQHSPGRAKETSVGLLVDMPVPTRCARRDKAAVFSGCGCMREAACGQRPTVPLLRVWIAGTSLRSRLHRASLVFRRMSMRARHVLLLSGKAKAVAFVTYPRKLCSDVREKSHGSSPETSKADRSTRARLRRNSAGTAVQYRKA